MSFWYRRTRLEKYLIVSVVITAVLAIGLLIGVIVIKHRADSDDLVCTSPECLIAAASLQSSLNLTADPCEDFYEFACGGWMRNNIIAPERSRWSQFDVTRKVLLDKLRVLLDGEIHIKYPTIIGNAMGLYKQCQDMTKRDSDGHQQLKDLLTEIDFPMLNGGRLSGDYNWTNVFARLNRDLGLSVILNNYVYLDAKNTTLYSIYVDAPSFGVGRAQLVEPDKPNNKKILEAYKQYIIKAVKLLTNETYDKLTEDVDDLIVFEKRLANITADSASRRDRQKLYGNKSFISEFENKYEGIPLLSIETEVFKDITDAKINGNSSLIVYDKEYFEKVGNVLNNVTQTTIANYLGWRTVRTLAGSTTKAFRDIEFDFNRVVSGVTEPRPVWEECVDNVNNRLTFAVGRLYVDKNFNETAKEDTNKMIDQLNVAFRQLLDDNTWMQTETKDKAREKLSEMLRSIGFPDFIKLDEELENYYNELELKPDNSSTFLDSVITVSKWNNQKSNKKLNTFNTNRTLLDWSTGPAIVNAFFSPNINRITFPAGILQSPFYTLGLPISLNLGAIGVVIGHEITHSFDDSGSQYDKFGNLANWWDNKTKTEFTKKVKCFIDQYTRYNDTIAERPINGSTTIGENIADNGGLRQAFRALENYDGPKQILPTSMKQFTNEQLFFLSFANVWCTNIRKEALINQIETDPHSPGKYRVWGSVSNSEAFAKAFNCKVNTNMNPSSDNKCILW